MGDSRMIKYPVLNVSPIVQKPTIFTLQRIKKKHYIDAATFTLSLYHSLPKIMQITE